MTRARAKRVLNRLFADNVNTWCRKHRQIYWTCPCDERLDHGSCEDYAVDFRFPVLSIAMVSSVSAAGEVGV